MKQKTKAFTLAEVLITLAIIGVVAALTIPTVIKNYRNHETEVRLKKVYTELSQATNRSIADNGPMDKWDYSLSELAFINTYLLPYLKVQKRCWDSPTNICPTHSARSTGNNYNYLAFRRSSQYIVLSDGTILNFLNLSSGFYMFVDINGKKGPNKMGVDAFAFAFYTLGYGREKKLRFYGEQQRNWSLTNDPGDGGYACSKKYNGMKCGALIQRNGWKIPTKEEYVKKFLGKAEDYPW